MSWSWQQEVMRSLPGRSQLERQVNTCWMCICLVCCSCARLALLCSSRRPPLQQQHCLVRWPAGPTDTGSSLVL